MPPTNPVCHAHCNVGKYLDVKPVQDDGALHIIALQCDPGTYWFLNCDPKHSAAEHMQGPPHQPLVDLVEGVHGNVPPDVVVLLFRHDGERGREAHASERGEALALAVAAMQSGVHEYHLLDVHDSAARRCAIIVSSKVVPWITAHGRLIIMGKAGAEEYPASDGKEIPLYALEFDRGSEYLHPEGTSGEHPPNDFGYSLHHNKHYIRDRGFPMLVIDYDSEQKYTALAGGPGRGRVQPLHIWIHSTVSTNAGHAWTHLGLTSGISDANLPGTWGCQGDGHPEMYPTIAQGGTRYLERSNPSIVDERTWCRSKETVPTPPWATHGHSEQGIVPAGPPPMPEEEQGGAARAAQKYYGAILGYHGGPLLQKLQFSIGRCNRWVQYPHILHPWLSSSKAASRVMVGSVDLNAWHQETAHANRRCVTLRDDNGILNGLRRGNVRKDAAGECRDALNAGTQRDKFQYPGSGYHLGHAVQCRESRRVRAHETARTKLRIATAECPNLAVRGHIRALTAWCDQAVPGVPAPDILVLTGRGVTTAGGSDEWDSIYPGARRFYTRLIMVLVSPRLSDIHMKFSREHPGGYTASLVISSWSIYSCDGMRYAGERQREDYAEGEHQWALPCTLRLFAFPQHYSVLPTHHFPRCREMHIGFFGLAPPNDATTFTEFPMQVDTLHGTCLRPYAFPAYRTYQSSRIRGGELMEIIPGTERYLNQVPGTEGSSVTGSASWATVARRLHELSPRAVLEDDRACRAAEGQHLRRMAPCEQKAEEENALYNENAEEEVALYNEWESIDPGLVYSRLAYYESKLDTYPPHLDAEVLRKGRGSALFWDHLRGIGAEEMKRHHPWRNIDAHPISETRRHRRLQKGMGSVSLLRPHGGLLCTLTWAQLKCAHMRLSWMLAQATANLGVRGVDPLMDALNSLPTTIAEQVAKLIVGPRTARKHQQQVLRHLQSRGLMVLPRMPYEPSWGLRHYAEGYLGADGRQFNSHRALSGIRTAHTDCSRAEMDAHQSAQGPRHSLSVAGDTSRYGGMQFEHVAPPYNETALTRARVAEELQSISGGPTPQCYDWAHCDYWPGRQCASRHEQAAALRQGSRGSTATADGVERADRGRKRNRADLSSDDSDATQPFHSEDEVSTEEELDNPGSDVAAESQTAHPSVARGGRTPQTLFPTQEQLLLTLGADMRAGDTFDTEEAASAEILRLRQAMEANNVEAARSLPTTADLRGWGAESMGGGNYQHNCGGERSRPVASQPEDALQG